MRGGDKLNERSLSYFWDRSRGDWGALAPLAAVAALALLAARFVPFAALPFQGCLFRHWTGLPCPGCGGTTAFVRLAQGDLAGGFDASPFAAALFLACAALVILAVARGAGFALRLNTTPAGRAFAARAVVLAALANWAWLLVRA